jgi:HK97 family phage portal protein
MNILGLFAPTGTLPIFRREATPAPISAAGVPSTTDPNAASNKPSENNGSYEEKIIRVSNPNTSLTISAVYRAVELKAKTIGQMEMQYQRKDSEKGNYVQSMWGEGRILNWLMQKRANPIMTGSELFQQMSIHRELLGNAFVYIERDYDGQPKNLWLALCGGYNPMTGTYTLSYNTDRGMRSRFEAPAEDVIHWRNTYRHPDGYMGLPTHLYAIQTLSLIATEKQQAMETAAKGGRMKLLIGEDTSKTVAPISAGLYDKKEMDKYADEINNRIYSKDVTALRALDKVMNISLSAQDQQLIEQLSIGLDDVARYYATPRPLLMLDTNSHYNDYTNATMEYLQRTIAPLARELEDLFDAKFLTAYDYGKRRFHMCELPLMRMDLEKQAKVDQLRLQMGWTVNEIRNQYDMPAIEKGNIPYVSTNLAELGSEKLSGAVQPGRPTEESKPQQGNEPNSNE